MEQFGNNSSNSVKNSFKIVNYKNIILIIAAFLGMITLFSCKRIETGEVGLRIGFDKQVETGELLPGSFNQTLIGSVQTFPIKQVSVKIENLTPLAQDNSTMKTFDAEIIYSINPQAVSELYITKNRSFHEEKNGDTLLMYNYIFTATRNAIYKAARQYEALTMSDARQNLEQEIKNVLLSTLASEKLDSHIIINQVLVKNILPADTVVESANALVRSKNELKQKEVEVKTAEAEARRMAELSKSSQSIDYMRAQALLNISEGVKNGKVQTIVVPADFRGMVNVQN